MKKIIIAIIVVGVLGAGLFFMQGKDDSIKPIALATVTPKVEPTKEDIPAVTIIAKNLEVPWDIAFLNDDEMLVTERVGKLLHITKSGEIKEIVVNEVKKTGEGGLLGITLHPDFEKNHLLYLYMSALSNNGNTENQVIRYRYENSKLTKDKDIISGIPGAIYHDGGRMEFGPDGMLYVTTGDATTPEIAQKRSSLGGKILRIKDDGGTPSDNPFGTGVYSYGHRNPQGLAWDSSGRLWETEHGRSGALSGLDEINLIKPGKNYGWPAIEGDKKQADMVVPARHSGASTTWAPASAAILGNSLFFGGLRGEALYEAILEGDRVVGLNTYFKGEFGRIRTVRVGPDGMLYLTTSNRDGRGSPTADDDRIIRINLKKL